MSKDNFTYVKQMTQKEAILPAIDSLQRVLDKHDCSSPEIANPTCRDCMMYKRDLSDMYGIAEEFGLVEKSIPLSEFDLIPE